ncbi:uncharacterized protein haspin isoform X2 [Sardina pilchardus]|uniref:uncharacterized protein haspin isoform X2 n=1 Tax=Sardina pilchardus TaxID=27697 RepID=UPI002E124C07
MSDTMGRNVGPLFMRTYGRSKVVRKVDTWLTPDYRKKAFSSTDGSDPSLLDANDRSVQLKKRKKKVRPAKKKAMSNLKDGDSDVENVFLPEPVPKTTKVTSQRKPPRQPVRKGRGRVLLSSMSENEQPTAVMRRGQKKAARCIFSTSESEEDSLMKNPRVTSVLRNNNSRAKTVDSENSAAPEPGKYVTARRRVQSVKPRGPSSKPPVRCASVALDSSDDFARAVPALPRAVTRRKRLPLRPPVNLERTSSDVSMGPPPAAARAPLPRRSLLRESLNASADDPSLACHAPLFSSTPSAALGRRLPQHLQDPSLSGIHFSTEDSATDAEPPPRQPQQKRARRGLSAHNRLRETTTTTTTPASRWPLAATGDDRSGSVVAEPHHETAVPGITGQPAPAEQTDQSVVVIEVEEAAAPSPMKPPSQLADSPGGAQGAGVESGQEDLLASLVLFSRMEEEEKAQGEEEDDDDEEQAASGFVTAETRLDSLVEALKERCRTVSPVVRLPRTDLLLPPLPTSLLALDTSSRMLSAGETFSSCLDSQPADRTSARRRTVPVFELSSCAELPGLCGAVPPAPPAIPSPRQAEDTEEPEEEEEMEEEEEEEEEDDDDDEEEEEKEAAAQVVGEVDEEESCVGAGREASELAELAERLKARCVSCQPVILLDSLRLSPFLLRHHGVAAASSSSSSAARAPVPTGQTAPASKSSRSDRGALPAPTTPSSSSSSSNGSAGLHPDAAACEGQPERRRLNKRRLSDSFRTVGDGSGGSGGSGGASGGASGSGSSPDQTVLANRSKVPAGRVGTGRKACVSGLSANRWTKRDTNLARAQHNAHDSLDFGPASVVKPSKEVLSCWSALPVTPARAEQLNISSILAGLSPDASLSTHMWSRLKAALSVHKKKTAIATPRRLGLSSMQSPAVQRLNASQDMFASPPLCSLTRLSQRSLHCPQLSAAEDISDAEKVYQECQQEGPLAFDQCIPPARMKLCRKIGEGTFGEVFSTTNSAGQPVALKIIPVEGKQKVNGEDQKSFGEILHEIIISKELSSLDEKEENRSGGFIGLHDLHCVQGPYPKQLLSAWDKFDKKRGSENDRPDFFGEEQFFLILEFEFGGSDLENMNGKLSSLAQAKSILQQVTAALAVAEQALCFEHRDLHWGNVLVKTTKQKECDYVLSGQTHSLETRGVQVNIIDYSLSRLEIDGLTVSCDISADEELFMGQGDYQFDIYRKMREENRNNWSEYHPHTNVLWLHYLTDKLLGMKYKSSAQGAQARALKSSLRAFHQDLPAFQSAADVLQRSSLFP